MKKFILGIAVAASAAFASAPADAAIFIALQTAGVNGGAVTTITNDGGSGATGLTGFVYGAFNVSASASGSPLLPEPAFFTNSINTISTGGGVLSIYITETGLSSYNGSLLSSLTANSFSPNVTSVVLSTYTSSTNALYGGNLLATATFGPSFLPPLMAISFDTPANLTGPFSETTRYDITFAGAGSTNSTINISQGAVPEPATWAMMLAGFGAVGYSLRRRKAYKLVQAV